MLDRRVIRLRAIALGWYPSSAAAFMTRARIFRETEAPGLKQRETADWETLATRATSYDVARLPARSAGVIVRAFTNLFPLDRSFLTSRRSDFSSTGDTDFESEHLQVRALPPRNQEAATARIRANRSTPICRSRSTMSMSTQFSRNRSPSRRQKSMTRMPIRLLVGATPNQTPK